MHPRIIFCTTCKGRTQHIEQTLPANLRDNADYPNCRVVLVNYNDKDHLETYLRERHAADIEAGRLVVYRFTEPGPFKMAHAKNLAHRLGIIEGGDILVNVDADNYTGPGFAAYLAEQFAKPNVFLWTRMIKGVLPKGCNGRIAVSKHAFLKAGGYDEQYDTWSPDDKDFKRRLINLGFEPVEMAHEYIKVILHNDRMRFRDYPHVTPENMVYEFQSIDGSTGTVVNYGAVGCGVVYRNFSREPFTVEPIPTRIFGVGMHKTATTSLHVALKKLGYDSAHWKSAHWAKAIYKEMTARPAPFINRSLTVEQSYALSDLPIGLLYAQLDRAYPGSKFILTTRTEQAWLASVENHFSDKNPFYSAWDTDPFTHQLHTAVYGRRKFDAEIFLARYRRHNAAVRAYFAGRPDLLEMDMDAGANWYELCGFLKQRIPEGSYPRAFQTQAGGEML